MKERLIKNEVPLRIDITPDIDKQNLGEPYYSFVSNDGVEALRNYLYTRGRLEDLDPDEPLFLSNMPGPARPLTDVSVLRILKRAAKRAGLDPKRLWPHCLRAAFYNMLVGQVDDTIREFLFGHGIGIRTHYFAPQQIDKVREAYVNVGWDRTRLVKVEDRSEIDELRAKIVRLQERLEDREEVDPILNKIFSDPQFLELVKARIKDLQHT